MFLKIAVQKDILYIKDKVNYYLPRIKRLTVL